MNMNQDLVSICIATCNKSESLDAVLWSIRRQVPPFPYEIVVVDDSTGSDSRRRNRLSAKHYDVEVYQQTGNMVFRNSAYARNLATRMSTGNILIHQSDEVFHVDEYTMLSLYTAFKCNPNDAYFGTVYNAFMEDVMLKPENDPKMASYTTIVDSYRFIQKECYTGQANQRPLFFLGMVSRENFYLVGGNDEEFTEPAYEDDFLAHCLREQGCGFHWLDNVQGYHIDHSRSDRSDLTIRMKELFDRKINHGQVIASNGPWKMLL